ncbi:GPI-anchor biosynthesis protein [Sporothrix brasiliensis 5110]|uniref:GPI-anchor biosynthesis protein n=1 Tax=Sporothrix brasiliensis 5110 TaxID=1398154 RepID=A0A0C2ILV4_9PEZI|nr:GPI-anchor biosynthesis protein [Sporothrix brasiliensis 5110]KIH90066.1 GPI-anchor biosynthesis protein [Sporothrix brasiliensis 5110]
MASAPSARRRRGVTPVDATTTATTTTTTSASSPDAASDPSFVPTASTTSFSPLAVAARNGSPAVLLAALALCFGGLTGDPKVRQAGLDADADSTAIITLAGLLGVATAVQVAASVVGLPPAGSVAPASQTGDSAKKQRKARKDGRKPNVIVTTTLSLVLTALATPLVHLVLVLFGAPFLAQIRRTFLCAAHLAVLGLYPVIYTRGTDGTGAWRALASGSQTVKQLDAAVGGLWGACAGAWLGAVPIPLDWDRSWQQWPITVVVGIYLGHAVGRTLGGVLQRR